MSVSSYVSDKLLKVVSQIGKAALSATFPDDFEFYLMAIELVDSNGVIEDYFVFPIMPSQINKVENNRTTVKKSSSGTTVLFSQSPTPNNLSIKGDFGKGFKIVVNPKNRTSGYAVGYNFGRLTKNNPSFDATVKTGFGCIKVLQRIIVNSSKLDWTGNPRKLYVYNMALGESYLCIVPNGGLTVSQNYDKNMIWTYSLNLTILANLEELKSSTQPTSSIDLMKASIIQQGVTSILSGIKQMI